MLEDTPVAEMKMASKNFENVKVDFRNPEQMIKNTLKVSRQLKMKLPIDVELKSSTPWVRSFNNLDLDAVRLRLRWGPLRNQDPTNGDVTGVYD